MPLQQPSSLLELRISCKGLVNKDMLSKSDPMAVVFLKKPLAPGQFGWVEVGRTEIIKDTLNPSFAGVICVDYFFEQIQEIKFEVYDIDNNTGVLSRQDFLGSLESTIANIAKGQTLFKPLQLDNRQPGKAGYIKVTANESSACRTELQLSLAGLKLDKKDFFGKSDPFYELHKVVGDDNQVLMYRSEWIKKNLNPVWKQAVIPYGSLCAGNRATRLCIKVWDYDQNQENDMIGEAYVPILFCSLQMTVADLLVSNAQFVLIHPKNRNKKKPKISGTILVNSAKLLDHPTFLDYVAGGTQLNFCVAIDFTASNGDPNTFQSLHYTGNPSVPNPYQRAIRAVGDVLHTYDSDHMYPVYGFGAQMRNGIVSHFFAKLISKVNGNDQDPTVLGVDGILDTYRVALDRFTLFGPTNFAPTINSFANHIQGQLSSGGPLDANYTILLILTDGEITDFDDTIAAIVKASRLPMSIIIVGVGNADFEKMNALDGDGVVLVDSYGNKGERDIVQFVPFRNFASPNGYLDGVALAREVLAEIPGQITGYFKSRGINPRPPRNPSFASVVPNEMPPQYSITS